MPAKRLNIDLDEIVVAMEDRLRGNEFFLDTRTGEVHVIIADTLRELEGETGDDEEPAEVDDEADDEDEDEDEAELEGDDESSLPQWQREERELARRILADPERYVRVPQTETWESYRVMEEFAESVANERLRDRLLDAIAGKGAFRRFKDTLLRYPDVREQWFSFESSVKRKWAAEWLASLNIESTWRPPRPDGAAPA